MRRRCTKRRSGTNPSSSSNTSSIYPVKGEVPDDLEPATIGRAGGARPGDDVTIIAAIGAVRASLSAPTGWRARIEPRSST